MNGFLVGTLGQAWGLARTARRGGDYPWIGAPVTPSCRCFRGAWSWVRPAVFSWLAVWRLCRTWRRSSAPIHSAAWARVFSHRPPRTRPRRRRRHGRRSHPRSHLDPAASHSGLVTDPTRRTLGGVPVTVSVGVWGGIVPARKRRPRRTPWPVGEAPMGVVYRLAQRPMTVTGARLGLLVPFPN